MLVIAIRTSKTQRVAALLDQHLLRRHSLKYGVGLLEDAMGPQRFRKCTALEHNLAVLSTILYYTILLVVGTCCTLVMRRGCYSRVRKKWIRLIFACFRVM